MIDLNLILADMPLRQAEAEIKTQFDNLNVDSRSEVKAAGVLSIIASAAIARLDAIDSTSFPSRLKEQLDNIEKQYAERLKIIEIHRNENKKVLDAIEGSGELIDLDRRIDSLLSQYDRLLADAITRRDSLTIAQL